MSVESHAAEDLRMDVGALFGALMARLLRIILVTALLLAATFVALMFVPKLYESSASLLVEDRSSTFTQAAGTTATTAAGGGITIDALMSSQIELVKSRDTLMAVIDSQKLRSVPEFNGSAVSPVTTLLRLFGRSSEPRSVDETVLQNLNERLTVVRERDSAVVSIFVRSADPDLAANIANAIAAEHVRRRAGQSLADTAEAGAWLEQQIEELRGKVQEADAAVAQYRADNGLFAGSNGTTLPDQQISDIGRQITDAQGRRNTAQQRAELIRSLLASGQPVEGVEDVRSSPVVQSLMQSRATYQATLAERLATLLPAHPTVRGLNAQISQVNTQINAEAKRIADGLAAQVTVEDGLIASLNDDLARARLAASTQAKGSVELDSLTREAKAQRDLLDSYLIRYRDAASRTDAGSALPDVRIITQAAPSVVPASPKTALILGAVGFVALALQVGMVLFGELMSGRAVYDRNSLRVVERDEEPVVEPDGEPVVEVVETETVTVVEAEPGVVLETVETVEAIDEVDLADMPEPAVVPIPVEADVAAARSGAMPSSMEALVADMTLGRARITLVAAVSDARDSAVVADVLVDEALRNGLSVCRVDAGSGRISAAPGLTDLCGELVSFGDVVHRVREGLAEVPWGERPVLDRRSMRPLTLIEALSDIYEVVIVSTGRVGLNSTLPLFAGAPARLTLVR
ncbi:MAG TPA: GumC family protein, partial [Devosia sp.]|nr:GumC family protein [Devosia sp.]